MIVSFFVIRVFSWRRLWFLVQVSKQNLLKFVFVEDDYSWERATQFFMKKGLDTKQFISFMFVWEFFLTEWVLRM